eukprot:GILI01003224.1.p1 GENE.GILI01003224.1~~GILI01003224.1.p1  ORF type:complete len:169 (+),score=40.15 GILI01003224.1:51-509(+)
MLSRTLRKTGGAAAHAVEEHGHHGHHPIAIPNIERQAPYFKYTTLNGIHAHHEPNFRKRPAGWAGYGEKFADPFAPFPTRSPLRHFDRVVMGFHYGAGHCSLKFYRGANFWKWYLKTSICGLLGWSLGMFCYWERMNRNGWIQKNKSAVMGE